MTAVSAIKAVLLMALLKIRIEIEGKKPKIIYRRLFGTQVTSQLREHGYYPSKGKPTHKAWIRYNKQDVIVYLIDGEWVSYGEVKQWGASDE